MIQLARLPAAAPAVTLATESPDPGERVFTVAAMADGDENFWDFTSGNVRQVSRQHLANRQLAGVVETDMPFNKGNSGGPVVNDRGELVAVVEGYRPDARLVSLSVAVDEVRGYLQCDRLVEPRTAGDFLDRGNRRLGRDVTIWRSAITPRLFDSTRPRRRPGSDAAGPSLRRGTTRQPWKTSMTSSRRIQSRSWPTPAGAPATSAWPGTRRRSPT